MTRHFTRHGFSRGRAARRTAELALAARIEAEMHGLAAPAREADDDGAFAAAPPPRAEKIDLAGAPSGMEALAASWGRP